MYLNGHSQFTEAKDDADVVLDDEIDGDIHLSDDEISNSPNDHELDSSEELQCKPGKRKTKETLRNSDRNVKKNTDILDDFDIIEDTDKSNNNSASRDRGQRKVTFKSPELCRSNVTKKGKVTPNNSKTGKGPVKKGKREKVDEDDGAFKIDQTLAGSFTDVGDVFGEYINSVSPSFK